MQKLIRLALMSGLVFGVACGDDDVVVDGDAGAVTDGAVDAPDSGDDVCEGVLPVDQCRTEGARCAGDTLNTCAPNADGCLVRTENDCASVANGICTTTGGAGSCGTDPCAGIADACDAAATTCSGDSLTVCAANAMGCLVQTETDCSATDGNSCIANGTAAMCGDVCEGVTNCDMAGNVCDGTELSICAADENGCFVTTLTECADTNMMCSPDLDPSACADACAPATDIAVELNCATGTLGTMAAPLNTADGSDVIDGFACNTLNYPGSENVYRFVNPDLARVTIVATRIATTGGTNEADTDLYVLDGGTGGLSCTDGTSAACLDRSVNARSNPVETVEFTSTPGGVAYVAYDIWNTDEQTATYTLSITCEEIPCGNGVRDDFEACDDDNTTDGDGCSASCAIEEGYECTDTAGELSVCTFTCGDGMRSSAEACDDGNTDAGDGCSPLCMIEDTYICTGDVGAMSTCEVACGNGLVAGDETCDDGNTDAADGCSAMCEREMGYVCLDEPSRCHEIGFEGEGTLEDADDMWYRPRENPDEAGECITHTTGAVPFDVIDYTPTATGTITVTAFYDNWDGILFGFDVTAGDPPATPATPDFQLFVDPPADPAFDPVAQVAGCVAAGDDYIDFDVASRIQMDVTMGTPIQLVVSAFGSGRGDYTLLITYNGFTCGDGFTDPGFGETCDDGANADDDGCSATCAIEDGSACRGEPSVCNTITCGDGLIDGDEECDDDGTDNGDGCDMACEIEDTYVCAGEPSMCRIPACGDGFVDSGEECDDSNMTSGDGCDTSCDEESDTHECTGEPSVCRAFVCGDGAIEGAEDCDDNNMADADGCSMMCVLEDGFVCDDEEPTVCHAVVCGDGIIEGDEACDDNNTDNDDGCSDACVIEADYVCAGEPSVCAQPVCGNDLVEIGEICDGGAGCSADCLSLEIAMGNLEASDPTWDRPLSSCSGTGRDGRHYDVVPFSWTGPATNIQITLVEVGLGDGYLHLYSAFDAADRTNCIAGDDDFGSPRTGSQIESVAIPMGTAAAPVTRDIVVSSFGSGDTGTWEVTVTLAP